MIFKSSFINQYLFQGDDFPKANAKEEELRAFCTKKGIPHQPRVRATRNRPGSGDTVDDLKQKVLLEILKHCCIYFSKLAK